MTNAVRNRLQNSTALAVTIGLHAGIAAIALLAITVTAPQKPPPPILIEQIPDTLKPAPQPLPPIVSERPIIATIDAPIIDIYTPPPPTNWETRRPAEPPIAEPTAGPEVTPPPTPGITRAARFDARYADAKQPPYPTTARRLAEEGNVIVHIRIGLDGRVIAASLAQSSGSPRLDAAAVAHALKSWRFTPALADGKPIEAERDITVNFRLADA